MIPRAQVVLLLLMVLVVLVSAVAVVNAKYRSRQLFSQTGRQSTEIDQLNIEWKRLLIEHATWGAPSRIETDARKKLHMRLPKAEEITVIRGNNGG